jgi:hypothetical protein
MDRLLTRLLRVRSYHINLEHLGPKGIANVVENSVAIRIRDRAVAGFTKPYELRQQ